MKSSSLVRSAAFAAVTALTLLGQEPVISKLTPVPTVRADAKAEAEIQNLNQQARAALKTARAADYSVGLEEAAKAITQSLALSAGNFETRKLDVEVLLARHQFAESLERARKLNREVADDVAVWGLVADAAIGVGDYAEAEHCTQWMLNLRATNIGGLERAARLRELFGTPDGARQLWESAFHLSLPGSEERAWILSQAASLNRRTGRTEAAEQELKQVLAGMPAYQPALAEMARLRIDQRKYGEAVDLLSERYRVVHRPDVQYEFARALQLADRSAQSSAVYREFETAARAVVDAPYNFNRELAYYYVDHESKPAEALRIAKAEAARRQDVGTLEAYAWALSASGDQTEARKQMDKALTVGVRESSTFYHAGMISAKAGDVTSATRYFKESLSVCPESDVTDAVRGR